MAHEHGTQPRYSAGCRCRRCKKAWREYVTARRRAAGTPDRTAARHRMDARRTQAIVERAVVEEKDPVLPVELSRLGGQILVNIQKRTGRSRGAVIDDLLRKHGVTVEVRQQGR